MNEFLVYKTGKEYNKDFNETVMELFYEATNTNQKETPLRKIRSQKNKLMMVYLVFLLILITCFYWIILH